MGEPFVSREIGNYVTRSKIGEGGMGAVYAGEHRFLGTRVAIKLLHGSFAQNPKITQRFFQEAKASIDIAHPNIIKVLDFGQTPQGELYLVMELLDGQSLADLLRRRGSLDEAEAARIGMAIAEGLAAAHKKGITHRDLKPDNVFVTATGELKVLDFGIAKVAAADAGTKTGAIMGTPHYMAPEQAKDAKLVGPRTDIYALGAILFELTTGSPPFRAEVLAELLAKHLFEEPPRPSTLRPGLSPRMEQLILACLAKEPEARPQTMDELGAALRPLASAQPVVGAQRTLPLPESAEVPPASLRTTISGAAGQVSQPDVQAPRASRVPVLIVLGLVGAASMTAFVLLRRPVPVGTTPPPVVAEPLPRPRHDPGPPPPPPAPAKAKCVVRSDPAGALVLVEGIGAKATPALLELELPQPITVTLDGYQPVRDILTHDGETTIRLLPEKRPARSPQHPAKPKVTTPKSASTPAPSSTTPPGEPLD